MVSLEKSPYFEAFLLKLVDLVKDPVVDDCQSTYLTKKKTKPNQT
jgi:hypothetical protein